MLRERGSWAAGGVRQVQALTECLSGPRGGAQQQNRHQMAGGAGWESRGRARGRAQPKKPQAGGRCWHASNPAYAAVPLRGALVMTHISPPVMANTKPLLLHSNHLLVLIFQILPHQLPLLPPPLLQVHPACSHCRRLPAALAASRRPTAAPRSASKRRHAPSPLSLCTWLGTRPQRSRCPPPAR